MILDLLSHLIESGYDIRTVQELRVLPASVHELVLRIRYRAAFIFWEDDDGVYSRLE